MYCTEQNLTDRYGNEIANVSRADPQRLSQAMVDAATEIDDALRVRFSLPLTSVPASIERVACQIVRYRLYVMAGKVTELISEEYQAARAWLAQVARGQLDPGISETASTPPGRASFNGSPRLFNRNSLKDF